jgi:hypothetical protein
LERLPVWLAASSLAPVEPEFQAWELVIVDDGSTDDIPRDGQTLKAWLGRLGERRVRR